MIKMMKRSPAVFTVPARNSLASMTLLKENLAACSSSAILQRKDLLVSKRIPRARNGVRENG